MFRRIFRGSGPPPLLLLLCFALFFSLSYASSPDAHLATRQPLVSNTTVPTNSTHDGVVRKALEVLRRRNKARFARPTLNRYEFADAGELAANSSLAAALSLDEATGDSTGVARKRLRSILGRDTDDTDSEGSSPYSISADLAKAAALVAEASPQVPKGDHEALASKTINKYRHGRVNDTNTPPSKQRPFGRLGAYGVGEGFAQLHSLQSASSETYWMAQMEQLGSSPFAPDSDYKVRRS